jgi:hypothetical protein
MLKEDDERLKSGMRLRDRRDAAAANPSHETKYDELPAMLGQANHEFIVSSNLEVTTDDMQEGRLSKGV